MLDIKEPLVDELKKFTKDSFDIDDILSTANELKYTREIKRILAEQMVDPSDDFVRFFAAQVYSGIRTQSVIQKFADMTKRAFQQLISDRINERLQSALAGEPVSRTEDSANQPAEAPSMEEADDKVVTTEEEIEGYHIVKSILREVVSAERITIRDRLSYCTVLLDDNQRKLICRLYFNQAQKSIGVLDQERNEERIRIEVLDDIYRYADQLKATVKRLETPPA